MLAASSSICFVRAAIFEVLLVVGMPAFSFVGAPDTMVLWSSIQVNGTVVGAVGPYMDYTQYCSISNNKQ